MNSMYIEQLYTNCLAHAAYYIESDGEAAVIDPLRDPQPYIDLAASRKARIKYVFETHFHADFVSGHIDLSKLTGAVIVFGPDAKPAYRALVAFDGEEFALGKATVKVIHTPGHTIESSCFLFRDASGKEQALFTGDTLFIGDVGRPDLLSGNMDKGRLAEKMFSSLAKLKSLPDDVVLYPGHGAGSACGKNISKETRSTLGEQKKSNYALRETNRDAFVTAVISGLTAPPPYFFKDASINMSGYESFDVVMHRAGRGMKCEEMKAAMSAGTVILDTRDAESFAHGFIPGSVNIGLNGQFAIWAGTVLDFNSPVILVTENGKERESAMRLARIGYDKVIGFLLGGIDAWGMEGNTYDSIRSVEYGEFSSDPAKDEYVVLDVRHSSERNDLQIPHSLNVPLQELKTGMSGIDKFRPVFVFCAGGYRSMIAASLLKRDGFNIVMNLKGGINPYKDKAPELRIHLRS